MFKGNFGGSFDAHGEKASRPFNIQDHQGEEVDTFNPQYYEDDLNDDTNINYVDDEYTNDDRNFQDPVFVTAGHDENTRHSSFSFPNSYEDDGHVGVHTTTQGV